MVAPDGNLAAEFLMLERYILGEDDDYWCDVGARPELLLECLDIAASQTLASGGTVTDVGLDDLKTPGLLVLSDQVEGIASTVNRTLFGSGDACAGEGGKVCSDSVLTGADMVVLMFVQFGVGPYADFTVPQLVKTVGGCTDVWGYCGKNLTRSDLFTTAVAQNTTCISDLLLSPALPSPPPDARRLAALPDSRTDHSLLGSLATRQLSPVTVPTFRDMSASVVRWATWSDGGDGDGGGGTWYRIHMPSRAAFAYDLQLDGLGGADLPPSRVPVSYGRPPDFGGNSSAELDFDASVHHVRFQRHRESLGVSIDDCAPIVSLLAPDVALHKSKLSIGQLPSPTEDGRRGLCAFDVFVYVPEPPGLPVRRTSRRRTTDECTLVVIAGSTAMDGIGGAVQHQNSFCTVTFAYALPPPSVASPLPPPPPTEEDVAMRITPVLLLIPALVGAMALAVCLYHCPWPEVRLERVDAASGPGRVRIEVSSGDAVPPATAS